MTNEQLQKLSAAALNEQERQQHARLQQGPIKILQIGEGNFLRGFVDWMLQECRTQGLYEGGIAVTQPRPTGKAKIDTLNQQDRLYTLVIRGLENGEQVEQRQIMNVFAAALDPYSQWEAFMALAKRPELEFVVSNTTEAGLTYQPEPYTEGTPVVSFPGKLTAFLYCRYQAFEGAADKGLIMLPTELLERNGDELLRCVNQYIADWQLPDAFKQWVNTCNRFLNSLVDRIVTGYPTDEAEGLFEQWGYRDAMLNTAEPYHLWAIEAEPELGRRLPLRQAGLNVHWVEDLKPFQQRKVRILNGAHTLMTPLALLQGFRYVRDVMEDEQLGGFVRQAVAEEIIPATPLAADELQAYGETVFERFLNPFIQHRLLDIAMNSVSKFRTRLLPSLEGYVASKEQLPERLTLALAALLLLYRVTPTEQGYIGVDLTGAEYAVRDDEQALQRFAKAWQSETTEQAVTQLLASEALWGKSLLALPGLAELVAVQIEALEASRHE